MPDMPRGNEAEHNARHLRPGLRRPGRNMNFFRPGAGPGSLTSDDQVVFLDHTPLQDWLVAGRCGPGDAIVLPPDIAMTSGLVHGPPCVDVAHPVHVLLLAAG